VVHYKAVLRLLARKLAAPGEGVCVKQLLDLAPEMQWLFSGCRCLCSVRYMVLKEDA